MDRVPTALISIAIAKELILSNIIVKAYFVRVLSLNYVNT